MATKPPSAELLAILRVRIGLAADDVSKDAAITTAYLAALSWIEQYTDRFLEAGDYTETFTHFAGNTLSLKGYPVTAVLSIVNGTDGDDVAEFYHMEAGSGLLRFDGWMIAHEITVEYTAAPPVNGTLFVALLGVFDLVWLQFNATVTEDASAGGAVKSIASDGARVEFDVSGGSAGAIDPSSGLSASVAALLNMLRRESA